MKLRNKKTGKIVETDLEIKSTDGFGWKLSAKNLAELNEEWEDYKEPNKYWYYDTTKNGVEEITHLEDKEKDQAIGNYFETKEEAEKAVEKLKAWKRLKDKGFRFNGFGIGLNDPHFTIFLVRDWGKFIPKELWEDEDLKLLFGADNE